MVSIRKYITLYRYYCPRDGYSESSEDKQSIIISLTRHYTMCGIECSIEKFTMGYIDQTNED